MNNEPRHLMEPGLGVIEHEHRIVVYQVIGDGVAWARVLGAAETLPLTATLTAAIEADQRKEPA